MTSRSTKQLAVRAKRRSARVRARVRGTALRPRMTVQRSLKHLRVQVINDVTGKTLVSASDKDTKADLKGVARASAVGTIIAERATKAGVTNIVFDRGSYLYHGRIKALAEAARAGGLSF